jgi:HEAT repeat protein
MKKLFLLFFVLVLFRPLQAEDNPASAPLPKTKEEQHLDTLRFGTETEIASLIQTVKTEKIGYLDNELMEVAQKTKNRAILSGIFGFFGETEKSGLEDRAIGAITGRDEEANDTVMAAIDYLGKVKAGAAVDCLEELINSGESRFLNAAFRALGRAGGSDQSLSETETELAESTASFLLDYYMNRNPGEENKREIIVALGETGSKESVSFLTELIKNTGERAPLRMAALEAMAKIGDAEGMDAVIEAVSSADPNIRSSAVSALSPFPGEAAENAILEAFRDSYFRTRIGAAQAAGKRRLESAVPYLRYRAENDEVPAVKDEATKALGAINSSEAMRILDTLFSERKNSDQVRITAADMLLKNNADVYASRVGLEMDEAKSKNQTALYNGFVRILTTAKSGSLEDLTHRLIAAGGVIEKSLALDLILNNEFRSFKDEMRTLLDEKKYGASIARKAQSTLEKLGLTE